MSIEDKILALSNKLKDSLNNLINQWEEKSPHEINKLYDKLKNLNKDSLVKQNPQEFFYQILKTISYVGGVTKQLNTHESRFLEDMCKSQDSNDTLLVLLGIYSIDKDQKIASLILGNLQELYNSLPVLKDLHGKEYAYKPAMNANDCLCVAALRNNVSIDVTKILDKDININSTTFLSLLSKQSEKILKELIDKSKKFTELLDKSGQELFKTITEDLAKPDSKIAMKLGLQGEEREECFNKARITLYGYIKNMKDVSDVNSIKFQESSDSQYLLSKVKVLEESFDKMQTMLEGLARKEDLEGFVFRFKEIIRNDPSLNKYCSVLYNKLYLVLQESELLASGKMVVKGPTTICKLLVAEGLNDVKDDIISTFKNMVKVEYFDKLINVIPDLAQIGINKNYANNVQDYAIKIAKIASHPEDRQTILKKSAEIATLIRYTDIDEYENDNNKSGVIRSEVDKWKGSKIVDFIQGWFNYSTGFLMKNILGKTDTDQEYKKKDEYTGDIEILGCIDALKIINYIVDTKTDFSNVQIDEISSKLGGQVMIESPVE